MTKQEFEKLAMRNDTPIGVLMFQSIEDFYMSDNDYHKYHGGIDENKNDFVKRVFNGKVNTPQTIAAKIANEAIKENRYCLRENKSVDKTRLDEMDNLIRNHYAGILKYNL